MVCTLSLALCLTHDLHCRDVQFDHESLTSNLNGAEWISSEAGLASRYVMHCELSELPLAYLI